MKKRFIGYGAAFGFLAVAGLFLGRKKFSKWGRNYIGNQGNKPEYAPNGVLLDSSTPLYNKKIAFLGSSITLGAAARHNSFVDYLRLEKGVITFKEAVSGTTLATTSQLSYIPRMERNIPADIALDAFVLQLSTNDGRRNAPVGAITASKNPEDFDQKTTIGAIEYICSFVEQTWHCPLVIYTCLRKPDSDYEYLIKQLYQLQKKWGFKIIDLWADQNLRAENKREPFYMVDDAHPTMMGYRYAWTPIFTEELIKLFTNEAKA